MMFFMERIFQRKLVSQLASRRMMSYLKAGKKRFYKKVNIQPTVDGFLIQLDEKTVKTPLLNQLYAPTKDLAFAVAQEWHMQSSEIDMHSMPLTTICNTSIDNPTQITKEHLVDELVNFLQTDTICSLAEDPESLVLLQEEKWRPIRKWFSKRYSVDIHASHDLFNLIQSDHTVSTMRECLLHMNNWQLNGLQTAIDSLKSFILPFAVIDREISVEESVYLSRLEVEFQIEKWGNVEHAHDVEKYNLQTNVAAGSLVYQLCSNLMHDR